MVQVKTNIGTHESARRERFEPSGNVTATNVQGAIQQVDTEAAGKVAQVGTIRKPASAATVTINTTDIEVGIDTRSTAVTVDLPGVVAWSAQNPNGLELTISDYYGNAAANAITPALSGSDVFAGAWGTSGPVIKTDSGILKLRPDPAVPAWIVYGAN